MDCFVISFLAMTEDVLGCQPCLFVLFCGVIVVLEGVGEVEGLDDWNVGMLDIGIVMDVFQHHAAKAAAGAFFDGDQCMVVGG